MREPARNVDIRDVHCVEGFVRTLDVFIRMSHMVVLGAKVWLRKNDFSLASAQYGQNVREIADCLYKIPYVSYAMVNFGVP